MNTKVGKKEGNWASGIADIDHFKKDECIKNVNRAFQSIRIVNDQKEALKDADLLIESITENFDIKKHFMNKFQLCYQRKL